MIQLEGELRRTVAGDDCVACCTSTLSERNTSWQQTQNKSLFEGLDFLGTWNSETEDKFSKCNVTTTESVISSSDEQLFISWGFVMAGHPDYCSRACNSNAKAMTILHETLLQQLMESQKKAVGDMTSDIKDDVNSTLNVSGAALLQNTGGCSDGCYSGNYYSSWWSGGQGAAGSFCLTSTTDGSMSISGTTLATHSLWGTCHSISFNEPHLSGGSGSCNALGYIRSTKCKGSNKVTAYLNRSPNEVSVSKTSGLLLLARYATEGKMSIDQLLDHPEHGRHAQDLLLDYYKDSIEAGDSLIELSRRDAQIQNHAHTLEHRHLERAMALHSRLPDVDKKHNFMPIGYTLSVRQRYVQRPRQ